MSVVDASSSFEGRVHSSGDLRVAGSVTGEVLCQGTLLVAEGATSAGRVRAGAVDVNGHVDGAVRCSGRMRLAGTAVVTAGIRAAALVVEAGASLRGHVETGPVSLDEEWTDGPGAASAEAYCVRCKVKRPMNGGEAVTLRNGRAAIEGTCPECGTKVFRMVGGAAKASPASAPLW